MSTLILILWKIIFLSWMVHLGCNNLMIKYTYSYTEKNDFPFIKYRGHFYIYIEIFFSNLEKIL